MTLKPASGLRDVRGVTDAQKRMTKTFMQGATLRSSRFHG